MPHREYARRARRRARRRRQPPPQPHRARNSFWLGVVAIGAILVALVLILSAWGGEPKSPLGVAVRDRSLPTGRPTPLVVAWVGQLPLNLPVARQAVTAIGYHASPDAIALKPEGRQANEGLLARLFHRIFGGGGSGIRYYRLGGPDGPGTGALDVGAAPGVDVYSPVTGKVVAISDYIINGRRHGARIDIRPDDVPTEIVSVSGLEFDPTLKIGQPVTTLVDRLGSVIDLSRVEEQALARYTQDEGNHVTIEVHPGTMSALP
jgi:hypothetical protein